MNNLASMYWNQGRLKDAEELEVLVMEKRKWVLGEEHPCKDSRQMVIQCSGRNTELSLKQIAE